MWLMKSRRCTFYKLHLFIGDFFMEKIVITGMGAITPIGHNVSEYWDNLVNGECGVDKITRFDTEELPVKIAGEVKDFDACQYMTKKQTKEMALYMQYGYAAAMEAIEQAGELSAAPERIGITVGTALGGIAPIADTQHGISTGEHKKVGPRFVPQIIGNELAAQIAINKGYLGPSMTVSTACSSGGDAVSLGYMFVKSGQADVCVCVGTESALNQLFILGLSSAHALSTNNDNPKESSCPFNKGRDGFVIGEGGGAIVLETESHAKKRGAHIYAELAGSANCTDGYHVTSPHPEGIGAVFCMEEALKCAGIDKSEIGYINTHGTSTHVGDPIEANAIVKVFGDKAYDIAVTSTKGATGHMMGAGGITEIITCVKVIETGIVPPTLNLKEIDDDIPKLNFVPLHSIEKSVNAAMSNSFGFGGQNSCVVLKKYN